MRRTRALIIGVAVAALVATSCEWRFETLDGHQNGPNGRVDATAGWFNAGLLYNSRPHVFYYDDTAGALRHAYYNGSFWAFETLDGTGGPNGRIDGELGMHASAVLYNGRPHVFYYDATSGDLRHAYYNGSFWAFETLDGTGGPNGRLDGEIGMHASAVLYNGRPHVFYYDANNGNLRHAYYNGVAWAFETLDGHQNGPNGRTMGTVGLYTTTILYNGRPHVFYYDTGDELRHAYYNGQAWGFETLDGDGGPNGRTARSVGEYGAALLYNNRPHVFYYDTDDGALRHGYWNGQFWAFETLDGTGGSNGRTNTDVGLFDAAMLYNSRPHVFYYEADGGGNLRHAYYNGVAWAFETLDGNGGPNGRTMNDVGTHNAAVLHNGRPRVFYNDDDDELLRHAYYNGVAWAFETLDGNGGPNGRTNNFVGTYSAVVLYGGRPDVFYYDYSDGNLRHAWFG